ncbi:MAG: TraR/DksA C4-type zinc finger protein [Pseudohongiellaceae bacterium]
MDRNHFQELDAHIRNRISELQVLLGDPEQAQENKAAAISEEEDSEVQRQITEKELQELARLKSNLRWLESDDGGYCEKCDSEIPVARLRAVPITRLCINCAK